MKRKVILGVSVLFFLSIVGVGIWIFQESTKDQPQPGDDTSVMNNDDSEEDLDDGAIPPTSDTTNNGNNTPPVERSESDLNTYIIKDNPSLIDTSTNLPIFTIVNKAEPIDGWYIVTLRNNEVDTSDAQIVIRDTNGTLTTVAGPGTGLHTQQNLPAEIRRALEK